MPPAVEFALQQALSPKLRFKCMPTERKGSSQVLGDMASLTRSTQRLSPRGELKKQEILRALSQCTSSGA